MRVRTVKHARVAFGQCEWGGPLIVVPVLAGSTFYADRVRCASGPVDAYVSSPLHVKNADGSLTIYEVQGGDTITDDTLRDTAALDAWEAWCGGVGVTDARS